MESECIALDKAGEEAEWLQNFLEDIPYWPKPVASVCIHCDSQATIGRAGSMMYNRKSCHIRQRHNTVRKLLSSGIITVDYVKSKDNVSDPLIKGLSREGVKRTSKGMGLRPRTSQHGDSVYPKYKRNNSSNKTGWSLPWIMHLSSTTLGIWMSLADKIGQFAAYALCGFIHAQLVFYAF
ncbi:hypothetical protein BC332_11583 [Capsicum chinense]|nr:hypothetical protein BC332_11583 [Capsicum chinense]